MCLICFPSFFFFLGLQIEACAKNVPYHWATLPDPLSIYLFIYILTEVTHSYICPCNLQKAQTKLEKWVWESEVGLKFPCNWVLLYCLNSISIVIFIITAGRKTKTPKEHVRQGHELPLSQRSPARVHTLWEETAEFPFLFILYLKE